jgi:hypothetical protein
MDDLLVSVVARRLWPIAVVAVRSTALIVVMSALIYMVLPAALVAARAQGLLGG